jgi:hypothetical protein
MLPIPGHGRRIKSSALIDYKNRRPQAATIDRGAKVSM